MYRRTAVCAADDRPPLTGCHRAARPPPHSRARRVGWQLPHSWCFCSRNGVGPTASKSTAEARRSSSRSSRHSSTRPPRSATPRHQFGQKEQLPTLRNGNAHTSKLTGGSSGAGRALDSYQAPPDQRIQVSLGASSVPGSGLAMRADLIEKSNNLANIDKLPQSSLPRRLRWLVGSGHMLGWFR
jgi:hypothetical protein